MSVIFSLSVYVRGIGYMQNMRPFKTVCPLRNELHLDITTAVKVKVEVASCPRQQTLVHHDNRNLSSTVNGVFACSHSYFAPCDTFFLLFCSIICSIRKELQSGTRA